jgi:transposase
MAKLPRNKYTPEFREQAVALVIRDGKTVPAAAKELSMSVKTLGKWVAWSKTDKLRTVNQKAKPVSELEMENARLKRALAESEMEREVIKKTLAYFARESLPGTRGWK